MNSAGGEGLLVFLWDMGMTLVRTDEQATRSLATTIADGNVRFFYVWPFFDDNGRDDNYGTGAEDNDALASQ